MKKIVLYFLIYNIVLNAYDYDLIVIGSGAAGTAAALTANHFKNKKTALIKSINIETETIYYNSISTRTLVYAANIVNYIKKAHQHGILFKEPPSLLYSKLFEHIEQVSHNVHNNIVKKLRKTKIDIINGTAQFVDNHTITVNNKILTSNTFIIATGSTPQIPNIQDIETIPYVTPEIFFKQKELPKSVIIIGGGSLGTEMAFCLNRFGTDVTLIMKHALLLPTFDYELAQKLETKLAKEGAHIYCGMQTKKVKTRNGLFELTCIDWQSQVHTFTATSIFIATNRKPNISELSLENCSVEYSEKGIQVNTNMQTSCPNIYACGDVIGSYLSVRSACYEAKIATHNALKSIYEQKKHTNHKNFTQILYTTPSYATVGFTEQDAYSLYGDTINIYKYDYTNLDKAHIEGTTEGIAKFVCDKKNNLIGAHILGAHSEELIGFVEVGKPFDKFCIHHLQETHPYPSYMDIFWDISIARKNNGSKKFKIVHAIINSLQKWIQSTFTYFNK